LRRGTKKRRRCYRTPHTEPRLQIDIFPKNIHQSAYNEAVTNLISKQYPSINTLYSTPTPEHHNYADSLHLTATLPIAPTIILLLLALHCSRPDPTRLLRSAHQRRRSLCPRITRAREFIPEVFLILTRARRRSAEGIPEIFLFGLDVAPCRAIIAFYKASKSSPCCCGSRLNTLA